MGINASPDFFLRPDQGTNPVGNLCLPGKGFCTEDSGMKVVPVAPEAVNATSPAVLAR